MDMEIAQSIVDNLTPWPDAWEDTHSAEYLHTDAYQRVLPPYKEGVWQYAVSDWFHLLTYLTAFQKSTIADWKPPKPFVYTPLHGVGGLVFPDLCRSVGINDFVSVADQAEPNPDFPTVSFPNPEEAGALDLSMQVADKEGSSLIIAHDPDADRFAVAEKVE
jgi:phosphoglucomutase